MAKDIKKIKDPGKTMSEKDVIQLLQKVREFQEENQKYLIKTPNEAPKAKLMIINMANTNY